MRIKLAVFAPANIELCLRVRRPLTRVVRAERKEKEEEKKEFTLTNASVDSSSSSSLIDSKTLDLMINTSNNESVLFDCVNGKRAKDAQCQVRAIQKLKCLSLSLSVSVCYLLCLLVKSVSIPVRVDHFERIHHPVVLSEPHDMNACESWMLVDASVAGAITKLSLFNIRALIVVWISRVRQKFAS